MSGGIVYKHDYEEVVQAGKTAVDNLKFDYNTDYGYLKFIKPVITLNGTQYDIRVYYIEGINY